MSTRKSRKAATVAAAEPKQLADEDVLPGYQIMHVMNGPNPDGLTHQAEIAQTLPDEES